MQMTQQEVQRYSRVAMALHWLTVLLVLAAFILGPGGSEERIYAAARGTQRQLHESLGITVFVLTFVRLAWRWQDTQPAPPAVAAWMTMVARLVQYALYILLLLLPITAITGAWLEGHPVTLILGIKLGPWLGTQHGLGENIAHLHKWLGDAIIWLAGLHALAAIYHHVMLKDEVLQAMLPHKLAKVLPRGK